MVIHSDNFSDLQFSCLPIYRIVNGSRPWVYLWKDYAAGQSRCSNRLDDRRIKKVEPLIAIYVEVGEYLMTIATGANYHRKQANSLRRLPH